jgi:pimeloyl-ACP methyl ester carboxylesterase
MIRDFRGSGDIRLCADVYGNENAQHSVLLAHGGGQTRHAWQQTAKRLAEDGFYSITLDLRGHGNSDWAEDGDYSIDIFAQDYLKICEELPDKPVLVGASLGGIAAIVAAGEFESDLFKAIVLVDIAPRLEASGIEKIMQFMGSHVHEGFESLDEAADVIAAYLPHRKRPSNLTGLGKNLKLGKDGRYRWHWDPKFMNAFGKPTASRNPERLEEAVQSIDSPMMLIRGKMSELVTEEAAKQFLDLVPTATYADVSDAGHMVAGDNNDIFSDKLIEFLYTLK